LIGNRKVEIEIAVKMARKCADSVAHLKNNNAAYAAGAAAHYAVYAAAYTADAVYAATEAAEAATAAYDAYNKQNKLNKQFLREEILAFEERMSD
jgi:hypothetical protein